MLQGIVCHPRPLSPVAKFFNYQRNQKLGHMEQKVIYPIEGAFKGRLAIMTCRAHLCDYYTLSVDCARASVSLDPSTGHRVCSSCGKPTTESALRECDNCYKEFIDLEKHHDANYEVICPRCYVAMGLEDGE